MIPSIKWEGTPQALYKKSLVLPEREALPSGTEVELLFISVIYHTSMACQGSRLIYKGPKF